MCYPPGIIKSLDTIMNDINTTGEGAPKKRKVWKVVLFIFLGFIAITFLASLIGGDSSATTERGRQLVEGTSDFDVYMKAQEVVEGTLSSPASANFPPTMEVDVERRADNTFKVSSYVDSENGFGATIRTNWITVFKLNEDKTVDVYQVFLDGEEVYRKEGY